MPQLYTEPEYNALVEAISHSAFDPLSDDDGVREQSLDWIDRVIESDESGNEAVIEEVLDALCEQVLFHDESPYFGPTHPHVDPLTAGSMIEHSTASFYVDEAKDRLDLTTGTVDRRVSEEAMACLFADAKSDLFDRARSAVDSRKDEQHEA